MKVIDFSLINDPTIKQLSIDEIYIVKNLNNPHIIKYYNCFNIGEKFYLLMEFINNDLKGYITIHQNMKTQIPEHELWQFFYQCMSGLSYIHQNIFLLLVCPYLSQNLLIIKWKYLQI